MDFVMSGDASVTGLTLQVIVTRTLKSSEEHDSEWSATVECESLQDLAKAVVLLAKQAVDDPEQDLNVDSYEKIKSTIKYLMQDTDLLRGEMLEDVNNTMPDSTIEGHWTRDGVRLELSGHWELEYCHYSG
jgi:hypothetical protein